MEPDGLVGSLYVVAAYVGLRVLARVIAGALGTNLSNMPSDTRVLGLALLPQAGVALGLVLVVAERVPDVGVQALPVVLLGPVVFEVCGPLVTRGVLRRLGEVPTA